MCSRQFWRGCCYWGRDRARMPWGGAWEHEGRGGKIYLACKEPSVCWHSGLAMVGQAGQPGWPVARLSHHICELIGVDAGISPLAGVQGKAQNQSGVGHLGERPPRHPSPTGISWAHEDTRACVSCCLRTTPSSLQTLAALPPPSEWFHRVKRGKKTTYNCKLNASLPARAVI